jgi:hypothetical protein
MTATAAPGKLSQHNPIADGRLGTAERAVCTKFDCAFVEKARGLVDTDRAQHHQSPTSVGEQTRTF